MQLELVRMCRAPLYTIGKLYVDGNYFCDTLEDRDRGLSDDMTEEQIKLIKVKHQTAIPTGTYKVDINNYSNRFKKILPRLLNVKGFSGILIHSGNDKDDTSGCILVGNNNVKGKVTDSRNTFKRLMDILDNDTTITIKGNY